MKLINTAADYLLHPDVVAMPWALNSSVIGQKLKDHAKLYDKAPDMLAMLKNIKSGLYAELMQGKLNKTYGKVFDDVTALISQIEGK
jgi:hypothetical protein